MKNESKSDAGTIERPVKAAQVAEALGVTQQTITARARAEEIPHIRIGKTYRFRMSEVLEAVNRGGASR